VFLSELVNPFTRRRHASRRGAGIAEGFEEAELRRRGRFPGHGCTAALLTPGTACVLGIAGEPLQEAATVPTQQAGIVHRGAWAEDGCVARATAWAHAGGRKRLLDVGRERGGVRDLYSRGRGFVLTFSVKVWHTVAPFRVEMPIPLAGVVGTG
jgi:hypothetical protein